MDIRPSHLHEHIGHPKTMGIVLELPPFPMVINTELPLSLAISMELPPFFMGNIFGVALLPHGH